MYFRHTLGRLIHERKNVRAAVADFLHRLEVGGYALLGYGVRRKMPPSFDFCVLAADFQNPRAGSQNRRIALLKKRRANAVENIIGKVGFICVLFCVRLF